MKKILSLILCISILLSSSLVSMAYTPLDSVRILQALGVMQGDPNGNLRENDLVKRSEFAKMAVLAFVGKADDMITLSRELPYCREKSARCNLSYIRCWQAGIISFQLISPVNGIWCESMPVLS